MTCINIECFILVEVEGYGPYKPVPPPKPLQQQNAAAQSPGSFTPPPYRMPPYPLYNEPSIPGAAAGMEPQPPPSATSTPQGLHTHSSKFPVSKSSLLQYSLIVSNIMQYYNHIIA